MPIDSPEYIKHDEGTDHWGSSTFYLFVLTCMIVGVVFFLINHFYGVPPSQPLVPPAQLVQ